MSRITDFDEIVIEGIMDKYSYVALLRCISEICSAKSTHVAENWQDTALAKRWAKEAERMDAFANSTDDTI
jgi:hypothetical protein